MRSEVNWIVILSLFSVSFLIIAACTGHQAEDLFQTAQFEELQNNREHARQLYEDIIKKYPQSEYARKAEARLAQINQQSAGE